MPQAKKPPFPARNSSLVGPLSWDQRFREKVQAYRRPLAISLGGIIILTLCISVVVIYRGYRNNQGLDALQRGMQALQRNEAPKAIAHLTQAERILPNGNARFLALLSLGKAYAAQQHLEKAKEVYEEIVSLSRKDSYATQIALLRLGQEAEQAGEFSRAQEWYKKAADIDGPVRPQALLSNARVLERMDNQKEAQSSYSDFLKLYPDSPLAEIIQEKISK